MADEQWASRPGRWRRDAWDTHTPIPPPIPPAFPRLGPSAPPATPQGRVGARLPWLP